MIKRAATGRDLLAAGVFLLGGAPAIAQVEAGSHEAHIYAGELFGDDSLGGVEATLGLGWKF